MLRNRLLIILKNRGDVATVALVKYLVRGPAGSVPTDKVMQAVGFSIDSPALTPAIEQMLTGLS